MKPQTPKSYHHGGLRLALIDAGRAILEEEGLDALTLRACARRAGVSHAAPQHHFATLADLLSEIAATGFEDFVTALDRAAANATTPPERLIAMGWGYIAFAEARPAIFHLMFGAKIAAPSARLGAAMNAAWEQLAGCVTQIAKPARVVAGATLVWSLVHGFAMLRLAQRLPPIEGSETALAAMIESLPRTIAEMA